MHLIRYVPLVVFLCLSHLLGAQERRGNIVEYFGKEKIDEVSEGRILHLFNQGLVLSGLPRTFGVDPVRYDAVLASFIGRADTALQAGDQFTPVGAEGVAWDTVGINDRGEFTGDFRGGYLFLEYTSDRERPVLLEASGHTTTIVNGMPHEGDHYDYGWSLIPVLLRPGANYIVLSGGRFSRIRARLLEPDAPVQFTSRDQTLPDLLPEEVRERWAAVRIMNTQSQPFAGGSITARIGGMQSVQKVEPVAELLVQKIPFRIPTPRGLAMDSTYGVLLELRSGAGELLDTMTVNVQARSRDSHHKETFISAMDSSVQYYSVVPPLNSGRARNGLVLTVHGASVEAVNQAAAYRAKDSLYIVAATNRRPFGFAWEDWGRRDAIEVLDTALQKFETDPQRTYLTGHSMGGHGTWHIGVNYPDRFGAIAPAAGYADLVGYRNLRLRDLVSRPDSFFVQLGTTRQAFTDQLDGRQSTPALQRMADLVLSAGNASRALKLKENYLHYGVYILHGEKDEVVPTDLARQMRAELGTYHDDFAYYEYPDGAHWFGNESVDWPPLFEFFNFRRIPADEEIDQLSFSTASPGVSAGSHYVEIWQQQTPAEISTFTLDRTDDTLHLTTDNVALLRIDHSRLPDSVDHVYLDDAVYPLSRESEASFFRRTGTGWQSANQPGVGEKNPRRYGGFKNAFGNGMVLVYATGGTEQENAWYRHRAAYDAERWYYRGNGYVRVLADTEFESADFPDRNVILYGNGENNAAWSQLLEDAPFAVGIGILRMGDREWRGEDIGAYLTYPRAGSDSASVGIVAATGPAGMYAAYANDYFLDTTFFPDVLIFTAELSARGLPALLGAGYFGSDWSVDSGVFEWAADSSR